MDREMEEAPDWDRSTSFPSVQNPPVGVVWAGYNRNKREITDKVPPLSGLHPTPVLSLTLSRGKRPRSHATPRLLPTLGALSPLSLIASSYFLLPVPHALSVSQIASCYSGSFVATA